MFVTDTLTEVLPDRRRRSVLLVFCCTLFGAAAQVLIKSGANTLGAHLSAAETILAIATNLPLLAGYSLYGVSTILLVLALRHGELSLLYPVIALTYVWVTILSVLIFQESMNALKIAGIAVIIIGVAILGKGDPR
ncbi:MAG: cation/cationic drug transporter [Acidobacteria bacterium]|nr:MAG: cation/cationic drug transporter [Acidobacteriota bacterium]